MVMEYIKVQSSNIDQIGYDKDEGKLGVIFNNGGEYHYPSFPESLYNDFMASSSHGHFFSEYIKHDYAFQKRR
jgi:hypothetical protein